MSFPTLGAGPKESPRSIYWCHIVNEPAFWRHEVVDGKVTHKCTICGCVGVEGEHTFLGHLNVNAPIAERFQAEGGAR